MKAGYLGVFERCALTDGCLSVTIFAGARFNLIYWKWIIGRAQIRVVRVNDGRGNGSGVMGFP